MRAWQGHLQDWSVYAFLEVSQRSDIIKDVQVTKLLTKAVWIWSQWTVYEKFNDPATMGRPRYASFLVVVEERISVKVRAFDPDGAPDPAACVRVEDLAYAGPMFLGCGVEI